MSVVRRLQSLKVTVLYSYLKSASKYIEKLWDALPSCGDLNNEQKSSTDVLDLGGAEVILWKSWAPS